MGTGKGSCLRSPVRTFPVFLYKGVFGSKSLIKPPLAGKVSRKVIRACSFEEAPQ